MTPHNEKSQKRDEREFATRDSFGERVSVIGEAADDLSASLNRLTFLVGQTSGYGPGDKPVRSVHVRALMDNAAQVEQDTLRLCREVCYALMSDESRAETDAAKQAMQEADSPLGAMQQALRSLGIDVDIVTLG